LVVNHRASTSASGSDPVPATLMFANQNQANAIVLQTEDGHVVVKNGIIKEDSYPVGRWL